MPEEITRFDMQLRAERSHSSFGINLYLNKPNANGDFFSVTDVTIKTVKRGELIQPLTNIGSDVAQVLMDDLWNCGIRPTEGSGSAGSLAAVEKHLEDMRKISFSKLKIDQG